jgi:Sec-independent protein secretion pathway component TatC
MEDVGLLYGNWVYCSAILWQFGIFYGYFIYFPPFWYVAPIKIWQPRRSLKKKMPEMQTILSCVCTEIAMK